MLQSVFIPKKMRKFCEKNVFLQKQMCKYCTKKCVKKLSKLQGKKNWNKIYFRDKNSAGVVEKLFLFSTAGFKTFNNFCFVFNIFNIFVDSTAGIKILNNFFLSTTGKQSFI